MLLASRFLLISALSLLVSCSAITVQDYANNKPELLPEQFFDGRLSAHGVVKNRSGKVIRYFNADIKAYWKDGIGTLEEDFLFDDGEQQRRVWTLRPDGLGGYIGTAGDVIGEAHIKTAGNSMFLKYVLRIPYGDGTLDLTIDDRMYLVNDSVLVNESTMHKFGFRVGALSLVIIKADN